MSATSYITPDIRARAGYFMPEHVLTERAMQDGALQDLIGSMHTAQTLYIAARKVNADPLFQHVCAWKRWHSIMDNADARVWRARVDVGTRGELHIFLRQVEDNE